MQSTHSSSTGATQDAVQFVEKSIVKSRSTMPLLLGGYKPDTTQTLSINISPVTAADYEVRIHRDEFNDQTLWCKVHNHSEQNIYIEAQVIGERDADRPSA